MSGPTRHSFQLHRSDDDSDGSAIAAGLVPTTDGAHGWTYATPAAGLTVKDEGAALATAATSIDFTGAGVTASGTGGAKTVTIPGNTLLIADTHSTPIVFADVITNEATDDFLYADS